MRSPIFYLQQALDLAKRRRGFCAPNPAVGAIIVQNGEIIAEGVHYAAGSPHAEIDALNQIGDRAKGASLYVTLEPCCHFGRTPPCTKQIIGAGIKEVIFGFSDPHQQVSGQGENELRRAGIDCQHVEIAEITQFYQSYTHWLRTRTPWITGKIAISLDGKIARSDGSPVAITGQQLQEYTHEWRYQSDAILTTVETIINDDPSLNVRRHNEIVAKPLYVIDRNLRLPTTAKVFETAQNLSLFHQKSLDSKQIENYENLGVRCIAVNSKRNKLDLREIIKILGEDGLHDVWIEAGGRFFTELLAERLMQRSFIYVAAKVLGEDARSSFFLHNYDFVRQAKQLSWQIFGNDIACEIMW